MLNEWDQAVEAGRFTPPKGHKLLGGGKRHTLDSKRGQLADTPPKRLFALHA